MITNKQKALTELKSAVFRLRKVIAMVQKKEYCLDVIQESRSAQQSLMVAHNQILIHHRENCVKKLLKNGDKEGHFEEIMTIFKLEGRV